MLINFWNFFLGLRSYKGAYAYWFQPNIFSRNFLGKKKWEKWSDHSKINRLCKQILLKFMFLLNFVNLVEFFRVYFYLRYLSLSNFSKVYSYLGAYAYCFWELFQGLCLFGGLRLLGSLEYSAWVFPKGLSI